MWRVTQDLSHHFMIPGTSLQGVHVLGHDYTYGEHLEVSKLMCNYIISCKLIGSFQIIWLDHPGSSVRSKNRRADLRGLARGDFLDPRGPPLTQALHRDWESYPEQSRPHTHLHYHAQTLLPTNGSFLTYTGTFTHNSTVISAHGFTPAMCSPYFIWLFFKQ